MAGRDFMMPELICSIKLWQEGPAPVYLCIYLLFYFNYLFQKKLHCKPSLFNCRRSVFQAANNGICLNEAAETLLKNSLKQRPSSQVDLVFLHCI